MSSVVCCSLCAVCYVLSAARCLLLVDDCLLSVALVVGACCCEFVVARCLLFVVCCRLHASVVVLCSLNVAGCRLLLRPFLLFVVWCVVLVVCGRCLSVLVVVRC